MEQTAYFRAMGEKNHLNLDKFRSQVQNELDVKEKKTGHFFKFYSSFSFPVKSS